MPDLLWIVPQLLFYIKTRIDLESDLKREIVLNTDYGKDKISCLSLLVRIPIHFEVC